MKTFHFQIATPEKVVFDAPAVEAVTLPTQMGEITILPNHLPLVANLQPGEVKIKIKDQELFLAVSGGFINIRPGEVVVLADTAERFDEIDIQRAEEARHRAKQTMEQSRTAEATDYTALAAKLEKELARLKVARRHHDTKRPSIKVE
ncbi:ATP synthase F1 subunit epsilon [Patescibacteria group bacterium]|nr:ATP synthase F1 subunit epsilon [Patescibacteria group bacterium]